MTEAEYDFWTSPMAAPQRSSPRTRAGGDRLLRQARAEDRLTLFTGQHTLAAGIELIEVGGHTPGQLIVVGAGGRRAPSCSPPTPLHFYEEVERDRPFAILADLPAMYRAYDTLAQLAAQPGTHLVAGHDPLVRARFARYARRSRGAGPEVTDLTGPPGSGRTGVHASPTSVPYGRYG